jgi:hypothetical protein
MATVPRISASGAVGNSHVKVFSGQSPGSQIDLVANGAVL